MYDTSNSGLPDNQIISITMDDDGNIWTGTNRNKVSKFDGTNWKVYTVSNDEYRTSYVISIVIDESNSKWIGIRNYHGLARLTDDGNILWYTSKNSKLPVDNIYTLAIDSSGNKWIGTEDGLAVFRGGANSIIDIEKFSTPSGKININRVRGFTCVSISFKVVKPSTAELCIYNLNGRIIKKMKKDVLSAGTSTLQFRCNDIPGGSYIIKLHFDRKSHSARTVIFQ